MERTLLLIKPDAMITPQTCSNILKIILKMDMCEVIHIEEIIPNRTIVEQHYHEHQGKYFYDFLVDSLSLNIPVIMMILEGPNIISRIRELVGSSTTRKARINTPYSIRGQYALVSGLTSVHASTKESAQKEIELWMKTISNSFTPNLDARQRATEYVMRYNVHTSVCKRKNLQNAYETIHKNLETIHDVLCATSTLNKDTINSFISNTLESIKSDVFYLPR